jgi:O-Antigen ligase
MTSPPVVTREKLSSFTRADIAVLLPGLFALGVFGLWAVDGGGYDKTSWTPGLFAFVAVSAICAFAYWGVVSTPPRLVGVALASFALFTGWCFLSITWSDDKGIAWDGANRTALYLVVFALFAVIPWRVNAAAATLMGFGLVIAGIAAVELVRLAGSAHPSRFFDAGRLAEPTSYSNATAALFLIAAWAALPLTVRNEVPPMLRGLLLAAVGVLVETAVLAQSRGSLFAMPLVALLYLCFTRRRLVALVGLLLVGGALLVSLDPLLDVYRVVVHRGDAHVALRRAALAIFVSGAVLGIVGTIGAVVDRARGPATVSTRTRLVGGVVSAVAAVLAVVVLWTAVGDPTGRLRHAWHRFTATPSPTGSNPNSVAHFAADPGSGNRYDLWRVAWHEFEREPLHGVGVDNFAADYLRDRRTVEEPLYPFSVELRLFSQTGLVGVVLFGIFVVAAVSSAFRRRRSEWERAVALGCLPALAYWLIHGSADWFWEIPALTAPVLALLAMASRVGTTEQAAPSSKPRRVAFGVAALASACAAAAVVTSATFPWLSRLEVQSATAVWRQHPGRSFEHLDRARDLDPLSDDPDLVAGTIATERKDWPRARSYFRHAIARNGRSWYPYLELALVDAYTGRDARARAELREVRKLNPREGTTDYVAGRLRIGVPVPPSVINAIFRRRLTSETAASAKTSP